MNDDPMQRIKDAYGERYEEQSNGDVVIYATWDEPRPQMLAALETAIATEGKLYKSEQNRLRDAYSPQQLDLLAATLDYMAAQLHLIADQKKMQEHIAQANALLARSVDQSLKGQNSPN